MENQFSTSAFNSIPRNTFDLSHDRKFSCNMGELVPCLTVEVAPGDSFKAISEQLLRVAPQVAPIMHRVNVYTHYFFVPNRIQWNGWEEFITNPTDSGLLPPQINIALNPAGTVLDYLGYPTFAMGGDAKMFNAFPIGAYARIWFEYYRDQNLQDTQELEDLDLVDGDNSANTFLSSFMDVPQKRAWGHDYFTSCLPFAQKGQPVSIPIGGTADIIYTGGTTQDVKKASDNSLYVGTLEASSISTGKLQGDFTGTKTLVNLDISTTHDVDLESATAITINNLRRAEALQKFLELNARGGTRYIENLLVHFGVRSSDARLQRPEYLGGGKSNISFSEVLQMSSTDDTSPLGEMAGHGINVGNSHAFNKYFEEHGFIIGIMSVLPETSYMNPTPKWAIKTDPLEYLWPTFAQLGEQGVQRQEVDGSFTDNADNEEIFGYIPRYSEYRFHHSTVHGDFKTSLKHWHMSREFTSLPLLNASFISSDPTNRIYAVTDPDVDHLYVHQYHRISVSRALPRYGIPQL